MLMLQLMNLDLDRDKFKKLLYKVSDIVADLYSGLEERKVFSGLNPEDVQKLFYEDLPEHSFEPDNVLNKIKDDVIKTSTLNISPYFLAYVASSGTQAGIMAEMIGVALNQICSKWHCSPVGAEMEKQVVEWIGEFIHYPLHYPNSGGSLVSGGSAANMSCLATARKVKAPFDVSKDGLKAGPQLTVYASTETHSCIEKSIDSLGIGKRNLRKIKTNDDFTINIDDLEKQIINDKANNYYPICVVANAGTVNTGAVDPLYKIADICKQYNLWFHIDAAYGGPAAGTNIVGDLFKGLELADSIALDPHKWLYAPVEAGCALVKNVEALRGTFSILPDYLRLDMEKSTRFEFMEHTFQLSRNFRALKIWATFKTYGADLIRKSIEENIKTIKYLEELIDLSDDFEVLSSAILSVLCFRYKTSDEKYQHNDEYLNKLNQELLNAIEKDGRVFITGTLVRENIVLRACCINHRTNKKHIEIFLQIIREIGQTVQASLKD